MDNIQVFFYLRDALICISSLIGIGAGVFIITRKKALAGWLALAGFALLGIEPLLDVIVYRWLYQVLQQESFSALDSAYACLSGIPALFAVGFLIAALVIAIRPQPNDNGHPEKSAFTGSSEKGLGS